MRLHDIRPEDLVSRVQRPPKWLRSEEARPWFEARTVAFGVMSARHAKVMAEKAKLKK